MENVIAVEISFTSWIIANIEANGGFVIDAEGNTLFVDGVAVLDDQVVAVVDGKLFVVIYDGVDSVIAHRYVSVSNDYHYIVSDVA